MWKTAVTALALAAGTFGQSAAAGEKPTVVELFTSQGCYSCPAAEAFLGTLADRKDLIALEFHVDYWDELVYGFSGKWKDPFSSPDNTRRQRSYNINIRHQSGVYTPQMVIGGRYEAVGSRREAVHHAIRRARADAPAKLDIEVLRRAASGYDVRINGDEPRPGKVWLVRYDHAHTTRVKSGENKGKTLISRNIVREVREIGDWAGRSRKIVLKQLTLAENQGCAVLVHADQPQWPGPLLGAGLCPR